MAKATETAQAFADALTEKFASLNKETPRGKYVYGVQAGRKYDKIMEVQVSSGAKSVFAFIERTSGDLYKPAGWQKPAPHVRYPGADVLTRAVKDADPYGSFLYL